MEIETGDIVYSKAGRDTGHVFIVCGIIDRNFVLVTDGDLRRVEKPKKKRLKHLKPTGLSVDSMKNRIDSGIRLGNAEVRKVLAEFVQADGKGE
ncbi:MAG TPA: RNA-binding protein [Clostridiales bacterium]|nr:RNA-binding protein [Clostridiales bacterium]